MISLKEIGLVNGEILINNNVSLGRKPELHVNTVHFNYRVIILLAKSHYTPVSVKVLQEIGLFIYIPEGIVSFNMELSSCFIANLI